MNVGSLLATVMLLATSSAAEAGKIAPFVRGQRKGVLTFMGDSLPRP